MAQTNEAAIRVEGLGICFRAGSTTESNDLKEKIARRLRPLLGMNSAPDGSALSGSTNDAKWIFDDVSFDVKQGEVFGIIGGNGCGKTTLLKILAGVLCPTRGYAETRGRLAALLAVGTGFHPEYTGRENVFLNGMILGLSPEQVAEKFDQIVDFAEIGESLDEQVRNYSSGMRARLGFAVASQLESDIVILDEILSVGDAGFRSKSHDAILQMKREGRTIVVVSHNMAIVDSFCDRALLLKDGSVEHIGDPSDVIEAYFSGFKGAKDQEILLGDRQDREGDGAVRVLDYKLVNGAGIEVDQVSAGDDVSIILTYETDDGQEKRDVDIGLAIKSEQSFPLTRFATESVGATFARIPPRGALKVRVPKFPFAKGRYFCGYRVTVAEQEADHIPRAFNIEVGESDFFGTGFIERHSSMFVNHEWSLENEDAADAK